MQIFSGVKPPTISPSPVSPLARDLASSQLFTTLVYNTECTRTATVKKGGGEGGRGGPPPPPQEQTRNDLPIAFLHPPCIFMHFLHGVHEAAPSAMISPYSPAEDLPGYAVIMLLQFAIETLVFPPKVPEAAFFSLSSLPIAQAV